MGLMIVLVIAYGSWTASHCHLKKRKEEKKRKEKKGTTIDFLASVNRPKMARRGIAAGPLKYRR